MKAIRRAWRLATLGLAVGCSFVPAHDPRGIVAAFGTAVHRETLAGEILAGEILTGMNAGTAGEVARRGRGETVALNTIATGGRNRLRPGLTVVWSVLPAGRYALRVEDRQESGDMAGVYRRSACPGSPLVLSGGFYEYRRTGNRFSRTGRRPEAFPLGLSVAAGTPVTPLAPWREGGVVHATGASLAITPMADYDPGMAPDHAIQSKPIVVWEYENGILSHRPPFANRMAIGVTGEGDALVIGVFGPDGVGVSLMEFAEIILALPRWGGPRVRHALALDGGPSAHLFIPALKRHYGTPGLGYVPNTLCFQPLDAP